MEIFNLKQIFSMFIHVNPLSIKVIYKNFNKIIDYNIYEQRKNII